MCVCVCVCVCVQLLSHVWLFCNPINFSQAGSSVQEIFQGTPELPFPTLEDLPHPGIKSTSLVSPALADGFFLPYILLTILIKYFAVCVNGSIMSNSFFVTPWTVALKAPLSLEFSRQKHWNRLTFPTPGDLPDPRIEPRPPTLQADYLPCELPGKHQMNIKYISCLLISHVEEEVSL